MSPVTAPSDRRQHGASQMFEGKIKRVWTSPAYVVGLALVAFLLILLPLVYVGLIALTGYGVYYHVLYDLWLFEWSHAPGRRTMFLLMLLRTVAYVGPIVVGGVVILFMIKPFFARIPRAEKRISLLRDHEPALFAFVDALCETVRASRPRRIDVSCEVNAAAGFRRGWLSLLGRDWVLMFGAPLAACMTVQQFAGVLAHEFGHFSQGMAMRLTFVIDSVNQWFARVVYQRDTWDEKLIELSESEEWYISIIFLVARLILGITRLILRCLMWVAHFISCGMSRQMEFNADRYLSRVAGSDAFEATLRRTHLLDVAASAVHAEMERSWREKRLPDSFPARLAAWVENPPQPALEWVGQALSAKKTGLFDSHPAPAARIARARAAEDPGVIHSQQPAASLFRDFNWFSKELTWSWYLSILGPSLARDSLIPVEVQAQRHEREKKGLRIAERYFQGCLSSLRPLKLDPYAPVFQAPAKQRVERLKQARERVARSYPTFQKAYEQYFRLEREMASAYLHHAMSQAGIRTQASLMGGKRAEQMDRLQKRHDAEKAVRTADETLARAETLIAARLEAAVALLDVDQLTARVPKAKRMHRRAMQFLRAESAIHHLASTLTSVRVQHGILLALESVLSSGNDASEVVGQAVKTLKAQHANLDEVRGTLAEVDYPFKHADGHVSVLTYVMGRSPGPNDLSGTTYAGEQVLSGLDDLYIRIMAELAIMAETVEAAMGLPPLPFERKSS